MASSKSISIFAYIYRCIHIGLPSHAAGSLKSWESSTDLVNSVKLEIRDGLLSFRGKRVLEVPTF